MVKRKSPSRVQGFSSCDWLVLPLKEMRRVRFGSEAEQGRGGTELLWGPVDFEM